MTITVALAGKGGTGKSTISAFLVRYLVEETDGSILAIDADPASNLPLVLGMKADETVGDIREGMLRQVKTSGALAGSMPGGLSKQEYLDYEIQMALTEGDRVDLLVMGRPEGQGCYCAANQMLRVIVDRLEKQYDFVVIDNEAGMEHLSRRTTRDVDVLLLVTDPTQRGLITAQQMAEMVPGLEIGVDHVYLAVNRLRPVNGLLELPPPLAQAVERTGLDLIGLVPEDPGLAEFEFAGRPLVEVPAHSPSFQAVREIAKQAMGRR